MTLKKALSARILELCEKNAISPYTLAIRCGVDKSTIYSILGSKSKKPEVSTIKKICDGLEITLAEFFDTDAFNNLEQEIQ